MNNKNEIKKNQYKNLTILNLSKKSE
jgi:hypothetical protein